MIKGCLTLPFRILATVLVVGAIYLGWVNRTGLKQWVHEMTADPGSGTAEAESPEALVRTAAARLDSLARGRADSIVLGPRETEALVAEEVARRAGTFADSVSVELRDGEVAIRARIDASRLPPGSLGPVSGWIEGRRTVEIRGPLALLRLGTGEWRITQVTVARVPLPRPVWEPVLGLVLPGATNSFTFPLERWITGVRVTPAGTILYGGGGR